MTHDLASWWVGFIGSKSKSTKGLEMDLIITSPQSKHSAPISLSSSSCMPAASTGLIVSTSEAMGGKFVEAPARVAGRFVAVAEAESKNSRAPANARSAMEEGVRDAGPSCGLATAEAASDR